MLSTFTAGLTAISSLCRIHNACALVTHLDFASGWPLKVKLPTLSVLAGEFSLDGKNGPNCDISLRPLKLTHQTDKTPRLKLSQKA